MEQTLTPPPSFSVLRVRHRMHAHRTVALANTAVAGEPSDSTPTCRAKYPHPHPQLSSSPSRGRSRTRGPKLGLTTMQSAPLPSRVRPPLRLSMPSSSSLPTSADHSPNDDELLFEMSPVQAHSPTAIVFESIQDAAAAATGQRVMDARTVEERSMHTLASLWENSQKHAPPNEQNRSLTRPHMQAHSISMPLATLTSTTSRAGPGTLAKHRRGHSDFVAGKHGMRSKHDRPQVPAHQRPDYGTKTLLDLSPLLSLSSAPTSGEPSSPEEDEPFLYSFPTFNSSPLEKARQERAKREGGRRLVSPELNASADSLESYNERRQGRGRVYMRQHDEEDVDAENTKPEDPFAARALRLEHGADPMLAGERQLRYEDDDANYISHAFRSVSLETDVENEKDTTEDDEDEDDAYFWSQTGSSSASSSVTDDIYSLERTERSQEELGTVLGRFPGAPLRSCSHSRSQSYSRSGSRRLPSRERRHKARPADEEKEPHASAMARRGRPPVARVRLTAAARCTEENAHTLLATGERRVRGRTPAPRWRVERCVSPAYMT